MNDTPDHHPINAAKPPGAEMTLGAGAKPPARQAGPPAAAMPLSLEASFTPSASELKIHLRFTNMGGAAVLLFNRLWDKEEGKGAPDPAKIYRFIRNGHLRLLLGLAPLPRAWMPVYRNVPLVTRLEPGKALEEDITIPVPVKEHNVYFPVEEGEPFATEKVSKGQVFVQYLVESPSLKTVASTFDPRALEIMSPGAWDAARLVGSNPAPLTIQVLRRTDEFERLTLPTEER